MANQDHSNSNGFPESYYFGYGSNAIGLELNPTSGVPAPEASVRYGHGRVVNDESALELLDPSPVRFQHVLAADGLVDSPRVVPYMDLNSEGSKGEADAAFLGQTGDMNLSNGQLRNLPSIWQGDSSNNSSHGIPSNSTDDLGYVVDNNHDTAGIALSLNLYGRGGPDANENGPSGNGSDSDSLVISSGMARYVLEENGNGEGSASDGTRLSCKRKAPETPSVPANGNSTVSAQETSSRRLNVSPTPWNIQANENFPDNFHAEPAVATGEPFRRQSSRTALNGFETGARAISDVDQMSRVLGGQEYNSERNIHLGGPVNQQGLFSWATRNPPLQLSYSQTQTYFPLAQQPAGLTAGVMNSAPIMQEGLIPNSSQFQPQFQLKGIPRVQNSVTPTSAYTVVGRDGSGLTAGVMNSAPIMQGLTPNSSQIPQHFQLNEIPRVENSVTPTSAYTVVGRDGLHRQQHLGNNAGQTIVLPEFHGSNLTGPQNPNLNFPSWANYYGDIASSSRDGPPQFAHQLTATWFPRHQGYMSTEQYAPARFPGILNHVETRGQSYYLPLHTGVSAIAIESGSSVPAGGNARNSHMYQLSGPTSFRRRRTGADPSLTVPRVSSAPWRSRLARNALNLLRRRVLYSLRDFIVIDRSIFLGLPDDDDEHEGMRMDVDNMSYEELLAMEEKIGNVSTGLSESAIHALMNRRKYQLAEAGSSVDEEPCCICQEKYAEGEDLGKLKCGHDFHFNCIKQWLVLKNSCPICKTTGLDV